MNSLESILELLWEPNIEIECLWKLTQQQFQHIKNILDSYTSPNIIISDESIYDDNIRVIDTDDKNSNSSFIQKKTLLKSIYLNNYKIKASTENITNEKPKLLKLKRNKHRYRYNFNWFYIDITSVKFKTNCQNMYDYSYELELELIIDICRSYNIDNLSKYLSKQINHINQLIQ